jgi:hypothetical protein
MLKKNPSKNPFYEKIKMFKKGTFVIESFVTISSFDYDCTLIVENFVTIVHHYISYNKD